MISKILWYRKTDTHPVTFIYRDYDIFQGFGDYDYSEDVENDVDVDLRQVSSGQRTSRIVISFIVL